MRCTVHSDVDSTGRCRICKRLHCAECLLPDSRRPVCRNCATRAGGHGRKGIPLLLLLLIPAATAPLFLVGIEEFSDAGRRRNEEAVKTILRSFSDAQEQFRRGDRDNDNILDYATNLVELQQAGLVDKVLAERGMHGYRFDLRGSTFDWSATAIRRSDRAGTCNFAFSVYGNFGYSKDGVPTAPICGGAIQ